MVKLFLLQNNGNNATTSEIIYILYVVYIIIRIICLPEPVHMGQFKGSQPPLNMKTNFTLCSVTGARSPQHETPFFCIFQLYYQQLGQSPSRRKVNTGNKEKVQETKCFSGHYHMATEGCMHVHLMYL